MAIARLSMKLGKRGKGGAHADYIMRQGEYALQHEKFEKLEAVVDGNMPTWAVGDPRSFFEASDANERANAKYSYREMELSLPRELSPEQRIDLVNEWCAQELPNYPYLYAIHNPRAIDGGEQPHAHLMFSERENDGIERDEAHFFKRANGKHPEKGGARKTYNLEATKSERQNRLVALRERWQEHVNEHLARAQIDAQIDMRSYADQGVDAEPQPKLTPWQAEQRRRAMAEADTEVASAAKQRADARSQASEYIRVKQEELAAAKAAQERRQAAAKAAQEPPKPTPGPSPSVKRIDAQIDAKARELLAAKERGGEIGGRMFEVQVAARKAAQERDTTAKVAQESAQGVKAAQAELDGITGLFKGGKRRDARQRLDAAQERHRQAQGAAQAASANYRALNREYSELRDQAAPAKREVEKLETEYQRLQRQRTAQIEREQQPQAPAQEQGDAWSREAATQQQTDSQRDAWSQERDHWPSRGSDGPELG